MCSPIKTTIENLCNMICSEYGIDRQKVSITQHNHTDFIVEHLDDNTSYRIGAYDRIYDAKLGLVKYLTQKRQLLKTVERITQEVCDELGVRRDSVKVREDLEDGTVSVEMSAEQFISVTVNREDLDSNIKARIMLHLLTR